MNRFDNLKKDWPQGVAPPINLTQCQIEKIDTGEKERIDITIFKSDRDLYTYGITVYWYDGRNSCREPKLDIYDPEIFSSKTHALLHALGFLEPFKSHFLEQTRKEIDLMIHNLYDFKLFL